MPKFPNQVDDNSAMLSFGWNLSIYFLFDYGMILLN